METASWAGPGGAAGIPRALADMLLMMVRHSKLRL